MGEAARKLDSEGQAGLHRPRAELKLVGPALTVDEDEAWVLEAIMACYCFPAPSA